MKLLNKLKITLLIVFFIIIFFNLKAFAVTGVITEITVNMRKEPSTDSKRLMFVTQDYKVEVLEKVGEWYKIKYNGVTGYVYGKYVDVDDSELEVKDTEGDKEETTNKNENTNKEEKEPIQDVTTDVLAELQIKENGTLRLVPNITSNIIYTAKKAVSVNVIEQFGNWSYVYVDNIYGWVRTDNIVEKNSTAANTDKEDDKEIEYTERTVAYIKYSSVNLRKKASTSSTVLAKLKLNNEVIVLEKVNSKWSKVEYDGITGYISTDLLSSEKVEEKENSDSTSRDGETVKRDEETIKKEETAVDTTIKQENVSSEDKNDTTSTENKKEENKEISTDTEKKEETTEKENTEVSKNEDDVLKTKGEEIVEYAKKFLGYDYVYGGASPKTGFDCSGLTLYVYKQFGYTLSRTSTAQAKNGKEVAKSDLQPGDLLIFKNQELTRIGHVGIYIGNNKMIHSSEPGVGVVITDLDARGYNYNKRFVTARRILK